MEPTWGEPVRVRCEPGCPQEFKSHGIMPLVNGHEGKVVSIDPREKDGHIYRVDGFTYEGRPMTQLFAAHELVSLRQELLRKLLEGEKLSPVTDAAEVREGQWR